MDFLISSAYAQAASAPQSGGFLSFLPFIVLLAVLYFLLIRPQQKQVKEHRNLVASLKKGDEVVIGGGILGKIADVGDQFIKLQVADGMELKVQRNSVASVLPKGSLKD